MKSLGIVRKIDEVGRVVLPKELRDQLHLESNQDAVEIFVDGDLIILKKYSPSCVFCKSAQDVIEFNNQKVCPKCIASLQRIYSIQNEE